MAKEIKYLFPVTWKVLSKISKVLYPKAVFGMILVYIVYYLKKGGFDTSSLEVTLIGCMLGLVFVALVNLGLPQQIADFNSREEYEDHIQSKITQGRINPRAWLPGILNKPVTIDELRALDVAFDSKFEPNDENLEKILGNVGHRSFKASLAYYRANFSNTILRLVILIIGITSMALLYKRPIEMIVEIYNK